MVGEGDKQSVLREAKAICIQKLCLDSMWVNITHKSIFSILQYRNYNST